MNTFIFIQKNGNAVITLSAPTYDEAIKGMEELVRFPDDFQVEDENGECESDYDESQDFVELSK